MEKFRDVVRGCGLFYLGYTFSNRRKGVDGKPNVAWIEAWLIMPGGIYFLELLLNMYLLSPLIIVRFFSAGMIQFAKKGAFLDLRLCGIDMPETLKHGNSSVFGKVNEKINSLKVSLDCVREGTRDENTKKKEAQLVEEIDEWLFREEIMWKQRSIMHWILEGDNNTRYFQNKASHRQKNNMILCLDKANGEIVSDENEILEMALDARLNDTLVVLILKQKAARKLEEFHPISLCNVVMRTISKAIVNRVQCILNQVISVNQSAFIKGRNITDNILIAHHIRKSTRDDSLLVFKISEGVVATIKHILQDYEYLSGQMVNLNKLEILFSRDTSDRMRRLTIESLGVQEAQKHSKYLGLPNGYWAKQVRVF
ncbi:hypothetical protein QQ045_029315 [Rhodiola kirilowii]